MSTKERLNVNLDSELKKNTAETLEALGLDFTTAINIYFKQIVSKQKIPFEISAPKYFSAEEVMG
ncbi:type II toxin-antitoxin system RelB/DinJ family antitoxin, partial [Enterococcus sp. DIV1271a]